MVKLIESRYDGKLDVLVANVGVTTYFGIEMQIREKVYDYLWDLNVKSNFMLIKETYDFLRAAEAGANICFITSHQAQEPNWTIGVYGSTKATLENMVKWMKDELRSDGIRVNGIAPGLTQTYFARPLWNHPSVPKIAMAQPE